MPELSVVTPTIGRDAELRQVLEGFGAQDADAFELIVACDAAHPDPGAVEAAVGGRTYPARMVQATVPGASGARNAGIRAAAGSLILFVDDDTVPRPTLVREHLEWHERYPEPHMGVLGLVVWAPGMRVTTFMRWLDRGIQFDYPRVAGEEAGWQRFYTANASVKRALVEAVGGFDEVRLPYGHEDMDLAKRMHDEHGFRLLFNRAAVVDHLHEMTLESWHGNVARIARSERAFLAKHPEMPAYFHDLFDGASRRPRASGRGRHLAWLVNEPRGRLGERVWGSVDMWYRQQLAPYFLAAWDSCADETALSAP